MRREHDKSRRALERRIPQVSAVEARILQRKGAALVDVRPPERIRVGSPSDAERISLPHDRPPIDTRRPLVILDDNDEHALSHANALLARGYVDVRAVRGGFAAWDAAGLPVERPRVP